METHAKSMDPSKAKEFFENKMAFTTGPVELNRMIREGKNLQIVDVREREDYEKGHVPGAVNLPQEKWSTCEGLDRNKVNVLYCYTQTCHLAAKAAVQFASQGYPVMEMEGGFDAWKENEFQIEKAETVSAM